MGFIRINTSAAPLSCEGSYRGCRDFEVGARHFPVSRFWHNFARLQWYTHCVYLFELGKVRNWRSDHAQTSGLTVIFDEISGICKTRIRRQQTAAAEFGTFLLKTAMTRMEVRIRRIEQASVLNLRSHSISTFNHYDRRIWP
jgi:hypothetical protein